MLYLIDYHKYNTYKTKIVEACCYENAIKKCGIKNIDEIREITTKYFSESEVKDLQEQYKNKQVIIEEAKTGSVKLL